ncbi:bifunctional oligoribonuclease/PAP phosphatase NrnA [Candidatus Hydrogenedentota bacterium]
MKVRSGLQAVVDRIKKSDSFLVVTHLNPDGDAIGSQIGMYRLLRALGKPAVMAATQPVPDMYLFLAGKEDLVVCAPEDCESLEIADTVMALDSGVAHRLSFPLEFLERSPALVCIDHHSDNKGYGQIHHVAHTASSTGEIVLDLFEEFGVEPDFAAGQALYVAVTTDTGSFQYELTTPGVHRRAARLLELGIEPATIFRQLSQNRSASSVKLLGHALKTLELHVDGELGVVKITHDMLEAAGAKTEETEGIVNHVVAIGSVRVAVMLREEGAEKVKVSMRAKDEFDVTTIVHKFGGGGHPRAAGCTIRKPIDEACADIIAATEPALRT